MDPAIPFEAISAQAISIGASLVGVAHVATLVDAPSHRVHPVDRRVGEAGSVVVIALAHTDGEPEMDWWDNQKGRTPGNRLLLKINRRLTKWLEKTCSVEAYELPYHALRGGIFLKDAAVLAGMGVIGKNNLLITPQYGPRVRLKALWLNLPLQCTGPTHGFAPCDGCDGPCIKACPRDAFNGGSYHRERCRLQMRTDETEKVVLKSPLIGVPSRFITAYCRRCELACPVGQ
ncbi:MAG: epoxyqueuosine reductase [Desulfobacterales bacterium]|nr:epoxyqueuosine reductase [Desulfobacterales bacterium]